MVNNILNKMKISNVVVEAGEMFEYISQQLKPKIAIDVLQNVCNVAN